MEEQVSIALQSNSETESLDFKRSFNPDSAAEWIELIKDIIAIANSGGGIILPGVEDNGSPATSDVSCVFDIIFLKETGEFVIDAWYIFYG